MMSMAGRLVEHQFVWGKEQGFTKEFYPNAQVKRELEYKDGRQIGTDTGIL